MATASIGSGGGRDHATPQDWVDSIAGAFTEIEVGECYADTEFTTGFNLSGSTGISATVYWRCKAAAGHEYDIRTDTGAHFTLSGTTGGLGAGDDYSRIEYLGYESTFTGTGYGFPNVASISGASNLKFIGCTAVDYTSKSTVAQAAMYYGSFGNDCEFYSCIAIGGGSLGTNSGQRIGFNDSGTSTDHKFYNCLAYDVDSGTLATSYGFYIDENPTINNCASYLSGNADYSSTGGTQNYNVASDTTANGANSIDSSVVADNFIDAANWDFRVLDTGADIYNAGTSSPGSVDVAYDPANDHGTDDATWEIGAYDFASTPVPADTVHPTYARRYEHSAAPNPSLRM